MKLPPIFINQAKLPLGVSGQTKEETYKTLLSDLRAKTRRIAVVAGEDIGVIHGKPFLVRWFIIFGD